MANQYFSGLNNLRAFLAIDAVFFHVLFFTSRPRYIMISENPEWVRPGLYELLTYHFTFLAIPTFFMMSLFLFYQKEKEVKGYFQTRVKYIIKLYLFWTTVFIVYNIAFNPTEILPLVQVPDVYFNLVSGWQSHYWFIFTLFLLTALGGLTVTVSHSLNSSKQRIWLWGGLLLSFVIAYAVSISLGQEFFANPLPFLPVVFISAIIHHNREQLKPIQNKRVKTRLLVMGLVVYPILCWVDWISRPWFLELGYLSFTLPMYLRPSMYFGSTLIFIFALYSSVGHSKILNLVSKNGLAIFCIHWFIPFEDTVFGFFSDQGTQFVLAAELITMIYLVLSSMVVGSLMRKASCLKEFV